MLELTGAQILSSSGQNPGPPFMFLGRGTTEGPTPPLSQGAMSQGWGQKALGLSAIISSQPQSPPTARGPVALEAENCASGRGSWWWGQPCRGPDSPWCQRPRVRLQKLVGTPQETETPSSLASSILGTSLLVMAGGSWRSGQLSPGRWKNRKAQRGDGRRQRPPSQMGCPAAHSVPKATTKQATINDELETPGPVSPR
ncbi:uncharacterized protein LOC120360973 [Saimiri boliviensis]|uniref:uncharacterized protein LOC120360973 n=1 Tax=Saimiri boliviensis TaxID=27679 RepID=UPI003D783DAC